MGKKKVFLSLLATVGIAAGSFVLPSSQAHAQYNGTTATKIVSVEAVGLDKTTILPSDVSWVINFSTPIERYTVDEGALSVRNKSGNAVPVSLIFSNNDKTITVKPPSSGYTAGEAYTLYVKKDIYTKTGKSIGQDIQHTFQIQNKIVSVQGDGTHTYFMGEDGRAWVSGKKENVNENTQEEKGTTPYPFPDFKNIQTITNGKNHYVVVTSGGTVWTWGENQSGELGDGTTQAKQTPVQVGGLTNVVKVVAANDKDGNGYTLALKKDGTVWAWGSNKYGQLGAGAGSASQSAIPVRVQGIQNAVNITAGTGYNFAVESDGTVQAWGWNDEGQLGDDTQTTRYAPVKIDELKDIKEIVAGNEHLIAIQKNGQLYSWGANTYGQLGNGTNTTGKLPSQVGEVGSIKKLLVHKNSNVALLENGEVWAWGENQEGQLGDGTTSHRFVPFKLSSLQDIQDISLGDNYGLALKKNGEVWQWGQKQQELSNEKLSTSTNMNPTRVSELKNIKAIFSEGKSNFAIEENGTIWVWGSNENGRLGDGTTTSVQKPHKIKSF